MCFFYNLSSFCLCALETNIVIFCNFETICFSCCFFVNELLKIIIKTKTLFVGKQNTLKNNNCKQKRKHIQQQQKNNQYLNVEQKTKEKHNFETLTF